MIVFHIFKSDMEIKDVKYNITKMVHSYGGSTDNESITCFT